MGNNNTSISVTLDRAQPTIYYTGDILSGQVHCTHSEQTGATDDIYLTINGLAGYTTVHTNRIQNGQIGRLSNHHDFCIVRKKIILGPLMVTEQKQATGGVTNKTTFASGQISYPFSVRLPDGLPPTLHPNDYPFVRYHLELFVEKKWYSAHTCLRYPLRIYPRINLLEIRNSQCAVRFDTTRRDITVKGIVQRSGLVPGEQAMLSLDIYNPVRLTIKHIDVCLIQRYEIAHCRRRLEVMRVSVPQLFDINDDRIESACVLKIPMGIQPSYYFKSKSVRSDVHVNIHYDLKLEIKAKGLFADFELQVPIMIGTDSAEYSSYTNMSSTTSLDLSTLDTFELQTYDDDTSLV